MTSALHSISVPSRKVHDLGGDLSRAALLVIDMQNMFVALDQPHAFAYARGVIPKISSLAAAVRERNGVVAWTRHTVDDAGIRATRPWFTKAVGTETAKNLRRLKPSAYEWEICDALEVKGSDIVVEKYRASAFLPDWSGLHRRFQERGVEDVIIVGCVTNFCCQSTARDAAMLDYRVFFVSDATAAHSDEIQNITLTDLSGMGLFDIRRASELMSEIGGMPAI